MTFKISFEINPKEAKDQIIKLLKNLRSLGIIGATRQFGIKDPINEEEDKWSIFFDGDGNHRLDKIIIEEL